MAKPLKMGAIGLTAYGVAGIKVASDFETLGAQMNTAFQGDKKMAGEYFAWANKYANLTPFTNQEVIESTVKLKMRGFDPKKLLGDLGDMAGATGKTLDQAVSAFMGASVGEFEPLKAFGMNKKTIVDFGAKLGFKDFVDKKGTVTDMNKFLKVLLNYTNSKFGGGTEALSRTFKGALSTTVGQFKYSLGVAFGLMENGDIRVGSALDTMKKKFQQFNTWIVSDQGQGAIKKWAAFMDNTISKLAKGLEDLVNSDIFTKLSESLPKMVEKFDEEKKKVKSTGKGAAIGGTAGAVVGTALGSVVGAPIVGAKLGTTIGAGVGGAIGRQRETSKIQGEKNWKNAPSILKATAKKVNQQNQVTEDGKKGIYKKAKTFREEEVDFSGKRIYRAPTEQAIVVNMNIASANMGDEEATKKVVGKVFKDLNKKMQLSQ